MEKSGDRIQVVTSDDEFVGVLMPQDGEFLVLKLDNGYNVGIDRKKINDIKLLSKYEKKDYKIPELKPKKGLPTITILHMGGTIASKIDYATGGVVAKFTPEELISKFPELMEIANLKSRLIGNIMSENMRFGHYNILAKEIEKEVKEGVKGIIITHGTDTMHYTSAALSFMLENLPIPVILVGAQRSSDRGSTDAAVNIISAAIFATQTDYAGVGICMHETINDNTCFILPGTKVRKMHSSRRDAFKAINAKPIARVDFEKKTFEIIDNEYPKANSTTKLNLLPIRESIKVGLLKLHPNIYASEFLAYLGFDGLILEGTGLGHIPMIMTDEYTKENQKIKEAVFQLVNSGTVVGITLQTIYGRVQTNVYSAGRELMGLGVVGNYADITPETAYIKLVWLLSNFKKEEIADLMSKNLRGEISYRTKEESFFI